jgi:cephalosporin hydroxylase
MKPFKSYKWSHYGNLYRKYFSNPSKLLEIGVAEGGSLVQWRNWYPNAEIHGVDCRPESKVMEKEGFIIHILNQARPSALASLPDGFDVIIDDGGHRPYQQLASFKALFPKLNNGGVYVIEDLQMSEKLRWQIWQKFFGGPRSIVMDIYGTMNHYIESSGVKSPAAIHLYPHILFVVKGSLSVSETEEMITAKE